MSLLFGTGLLPDQLIHKGSDVGYILHIWQYGVVGTLILLFAYYKVFRKAAMSQMRPTSSFYNILIILIAIYLIKLTCLGYSMVGVVVIPLSILAMVSPRTSIKKNKDK